VIFQVGDSDEGREFAASSADAIFSRHSTLEAGKVFYAVYRSKTRHVLPDLRVRGVGYAAR
jgi:alkanesulfonate monooxygenase SsuD/methylene tetrahydromethanopterin reductase-like flavin-dependent oxidoreductase (luciferase family)